MTTKSTQEVSKSYHALKIGPLEFCYNLETVCLIYFSLLVSLLLIVSRLLNHKKSEIIIPPSECEIYIHNGERQTKLPLPATIGTNIFDTLQLNATTALEIKEGPKPNTILFSLKNMR